MLLAGGDIERGSSHKSHAGVPEGTVLKSKRSTGAGNEVSNGCIDRGPVNALPVCAEGTDLFSNLPRASEIPLFAVVTFASGGRRSKISFRALAFTASRTSDHASEES